MGLFNTQLNPDEDHAWQALLAAMDMHRRLQEFADADGEHWRACRISVHTGVATLGNVGNPTRRDFTAIGDMINVAKRLQEQASYGQVIISEDTYRLCQDRISEHECGLEITEHTTIRVRRRRQPVTVYEVICALARQAEIMFQRPDPNSSAQDLIRDITQQLGELEQMLWAQQEMIHQSGSSCRRRCSTSLARCVLPAKRCVRRCYAPPTSWTICERWPRPPA